MASTSAQTTAKDNIIVRKEEVLFRLGESSFLSVNSYRGLIKIHIRWFQELSSGRLYPTTNGITLSPDEFQQLLKFSGKIEASVRVLEKKKASTATTAATTTNSEGGSSGSSSSSSHGSSEKATTNTSGQWLSKRKATEDEENKNKNKRKQLKLNTIGNTEDAKVVPVDEDNDDLPDIQPFFTQGATLKSEPLSPTEWQEIMSPWGNNFFSSLCLCLSFSVYIHKVSVLYWEST